MAQWNAVSARSPAMLLALLTQLAVCSGLEGCANSTGPERPPVPLAASITTSGECARISFQITGPSSVIGTYPTAGCTVGLVPVKYESMSWNGNNRSLSFRVSVVNTTSQTVTLPLRLELPVEGKSVTLPTGMSRDSIVPREQDSTLANDRKLYLVGGTGTLAPGQTSTPRWLVFNIRYPVTKGQLWFVSSGEQISQVPAQAPDSTPAWFINDTSWTSNGVIMKYVIEVEFTPGTAVTQRQAAIDSIGGVVIGGYRLLGAVEGTYYVYVQTAASEGSLVSLIQRLARQPGVRDTGFHFRLKPAGRRPQDGGGWTQSDWRLDPGSSDGQNWNLEDVSLPLAWGCQNQAISTRVGLLEKNIRSTGEFYPNARIYSPSIYPAVEEWHGVNTANLLAAPGNDGTGVSGVLWSARIDIVTLAPTYQTPFEDLSLSDGLDSLVRLGASIINISLAGARATIFSADSALQRRIANTIHTGLAEHGGSNTPLLVIAAGNDNEDVSTRAAGIVAADLSLQVLLVGGSSPRSGAQWDRWGAGSLATIPGGGSNWGSRIDVYAPALGVYVLDNSNQRVQGSGTSYAAPLITGIAALLKEFDPQLTSAQLKALIVAGAVAGGKSMTHDASKYLANAYESLKLASNKPGTPVCGKVVRAVAVGNSERIVIERSPGVADTLVPSQSLIGARRMISIAQGGRQIATVGSFNAPQFTDVFTLANGVWTRTSQSNAFMTFFLEQDTAYLRGRLVHPESLWVRIGSSVPSRQVAEQLVTASAPAGVSRAEWSWEWPAVSPTGDWVLFDWANDTSCQEAYTNFAVPLRGGPAQEFRKNLIDWCSATDYPVGFEFHGPMTWRNDGNRLLLAKEAKGAGSAYDFNLREFSVSGATIAVVGSPTTVTGKLPKGLYWEPEETRVRVAEQGTSCQLVIRSATNFATVLQTLSQCDYYPVIGPSYVVATGSAAVASSRVALAPWQRDRTTIDGRGMSPR